MRAGPHVVRDRPLRQAARQSAGAGRPACGRRRTSLDDRAADARGTRTFRGTEAAPLRSDPMVIDDRVCRRVGPVPSCGRGSRRRTRSTSGSRPTGRASPRRGTRGSSRLHPARHPEFGEPLTCARPGDVVHLSEMFRLVRGAQPILDSLDVLHRDRPALPVHGGTAGRRGQRRQGRPPSGHHGCADRHRSHRMPGGPVRRRPGPRVRGGRGAVPTAVAALLSERTAGRADHGSIGPRDRAPHPPDQEPGRNGRPLRRPGPHHRGRRHGRDGLNTDRDRRPSLPDTPSDAQEADNVATPEERSGTAEFEDVLLQTEGRRCGADAAGVMSGK